MPEEADKREHSTKPEKDDLTDYQSLNSLGGAGVAGTAEETPASKTPASETAVTDQPEASEVVKYSGEYNDGSDFTPVDNDAETNS